MMDTGTIQPPVVGDSKYPVAPVVPKWSPNDPILVNFSVQIGAGLTDLAGLHGCQKDPLSIGEMCFRPIVK